MSNAHTHQRRPVVRLDAHLNMPGVILSTFRKAALLSLAKTLPGEMIGRGRGMRTNVVSLGPLTTPLHAKLGFDGAPSNTFRKHLSNSVPLSRVGEPFEFNDGALNLTSDEVRYRVSSELIIDGGMINA